MAQKETGIVVSDKFKQVLANQNATPEIINQLATAFGAPFTEAGEILADYQFNDKGEIILTEKTIVVTEESDKKVVAEAKSKRLALKKVRTTVENKRKELKEDINKTGQAIDAVARFIKTTIEPAEAYLELQEKFAEVKAAERAAKLKQERTEKLAQYTDNISAYNLDTMQEDTFNILLGELKVAHEAKVAKAEEERRANEEAAAEERKRQEEIAAENARLKEEAEAREVELKKEREAAAKEQAKIDAARAAELELERANAAEERRKREELEREQAEKQRLLDEEKRQTEAEALRVKKEAEKAETDALLAPDKQKLTTFANALEIIRTEKVPAVKTKSAQDITNFIDDSLAELILEIAKRAKQL